MNFSLTIPDLPLNNRTMFNIIYLMFPHLLPLHNFVTPHKCFDIFPQYVTPLLFIPCPQCSIISSFPGPDVAYYSWVLGLGFTLGTMYYPNITRFVYNRREAARKTNMTRWLKKRGTRGM